MTQIQDQPVPGKTVKTSVAQRLGRPSMLSMLLRDKFATVAAVILGFVLLTAAFGPSLMGELATNQDLMFMNKAPFDPANGWAYFLGSDSLGRSMLARMVVATQTTLLVAVPAVLVALFLGSLWGVWAGYHRGRRENISMRLADIIMSFPSLLLAVVVLFVFSPSAANIVLILAITRIPIYMRTARAESAELQSRTFVDAARTFGTKPNSIIVRHVIPVVTPTLLTLATLEFCFVMLAESSLSFLGIGIQPPDVSWGLMVAQGRQYLQTAWWLSILPGLAIVITAVAANVLAAWMRIATDPAQRWRLTLDKQAKKDLTAVIKDAK
ncbi:ABC transporter permease [Arthrobacter sp. MYb224]|uniref:ABC transporter permease n=1 Tax=unclassified Arthrobacter TaxID=235627 RepID=UPI000CFCC062|nr:MULTISPECIES: ABC transporter permease [unclassified Arthrobacter]PRA00480.1 ABC transporter permease [Arthrobacter sp. MYb224]PRA04672.1 ABC transporter permease [Arthrobacter sp. MYb229]PRB51414.1 ABC transporter permease [Arthrobacter sp. MYb216]